MTISGVNHNVSRSVVQMFICFLSGFMSLWVALPSSNEYVNVSIKIFYYRLLIAIYNSDRDIIEEHLFLFNLIKSLYNNVLVIYIIEIQLFSHKKSYNISFIILSDVITLLKINICFRNVV